MCFPGICLEGLYLSINFKSSLSDRNILCSDRSVRALNTIMQARNYDRRTRNILSGSAFIPRIYVTITIHATSVLGPSRGQPLPRDVTIRQLSPHSHHHGLYNCGNSGHHSCCSAVHGLAACSVSACHRTGSSAATGPNSY